MFFSFLRLPELNKVNLHNHARAFYGMPSSLFRAERLSRLRAENHGKGRRCVAGQRPFVPGRNCVS